MMSQKNNDLITRIGPGTAAGALLRQYWQPVALADELSAAASVLQGQGAEGRPAVLMRGIRFPSEDLPASSLLRPLAEDMFR